MPELPIISNTARKQQRIRKIRDWDEDGLSGQQILQRLKDEGLGIRRQDFYRVQRAIKAGRTEGSKINHSRFTRQIQNETLPFATYEIQRGDAQFVVEVDGLVTFGEEKVPKQFVTVSTVADLTKAQVLENAEAIVDSNVFNNYDLKSSKNLQFRIRGAYQRVPE